MLWKTIILLIIIFIAYLLIGAAIFEALEKPLEDEDCQNVQKRVLDISELIENASLSSDVLPEFKDVIQFAAERGIFIDDNLTVTCSTNWDLEGSFFFCGTVLTTIGYGHIAPSTNTARIICIFYAIIGIPLFAVMFTGIGAKFAARVERLESRIRGRTKRGWLRKTILALLVLTTFTVLFLLIPAVIFVQVEQWDYHISFYYAFITLTTVGFGDYVAGVNPQIDYVPVYRVMVYFWILFGLASAATVISLLSDLWMKAGPEAKSRKKKNKIEQNQSARSDVVLENRDPMNDYEF